MESTPLDNSIRQITRLLAQGEVSSARVAAAALLKVSPQAEVLAIYCQLLAGQALYAEIIVLVSAHPDLASAAVSFFTALARTNLGAPEGALKDCGQALRLDPGYWPGHHLYGKLCQEAGRHDEALKHLLRAEQLADREFPLELGFSHQCLGHWADSIRYYEQAKVSGSANSDVFFNLAVCQVQSGQVGLAQSNLRQCTAMEPDNAKFRGWKMYVDRQLCDWAEAVDDHALILKALQQDHAPARALMPVYLLNVLGFDDAVHLRVAQETATRIQQAFVRSVAATRPSVSEHQGTSTHAESRRIRVGYLAADINRSAVGLLALPLLEAHDHGRFDIFVYSLKSLPEDPWFQRAAAVTTLRRVDACSTAQISATIRADAIDILVDMVGHTALGRPEVMAQRPANIQLSLWGYLNSQGADWIDYIVADRWILPETLTQHYIEQPLYLERSLLASCDLPMLMHAPKLKAEFDLPRDALVVGAFNNSYKIDARWLAGWLEQLQHHPQCWLWIYASTAECAERLLSSAAQAGVAERLRVAGNVDHQTHLRRLQACDLFADTFGYNAGATAVGAIAAGLPILSCSGKRMLGRMGASINHFLQLDELSCVSETQYWRRADALLTDTARLSTLRRKLIQQRGHKGFGEPRRFCAEFEQKLLHLLSG